MLRCLAVASLGRVPVVSSAPARLALALAGCLFACAGDDDAGGTKTTDVGNVMTGDKNPDGGQKPDAGRTVNTVPGRCESGSFDACNSFVTTFGTEIKLGEYGVIMEANVGAAFKNQVSPLDTKTSCSLFASIFGQSQEQTDRLLDTMDLDLSLFTVYRPANWGSGKKFPIVTWGNGTCAQPEGYAALLRYVASQGFFVVAPNSRYAGTDMTQVHGLDFAFAANEDPTSPYYQKLDTTKVAAMGHSQGGSATVATANDPRVKTAILFNGGSNASKPYLTISGDRDIGGRMASVLATEVDANPKAASLFYHMVPGTGAADGHLTLMTQPERVMEPTVAWLKFLLEDDAASKAWFVGADCKLCGHDAEYEFHQHGLE